MASDIDIANLALLYLETAPIVSFGDNTEQARAINSSYALLRDKLQREYRWNFNRTYVQLPALSTPPPFEYEYAYELPADYLRLELAAPVSLNAGPMVAGQTSPTSTTTGLTMPGVDFTDYQGGRSQDYRIVGDKMIYAHYQPPLTIIYARREEDSTQFDSAFCEAFACLLAYKLCGRITGSGGKKQSLAADYQMSLRQAIAAKSIELPPETIPDDTFILSRISG